MDKTEIETREEYAEILADLVIKYRVELSTSLPKSIVTPLLIEYQKHLLQVMEKLINERFNVA